MAHTISMPNEVYETLREEAATENRSMSRQLKEWHKLVQAKKIVKRNKGMSFEDALALLEQFSPENQAKYKNDDEYMRKASALYMVLNNDWLDMHNAELIEEASESAKKGNGIIIEDIDAYFESGGRKGHRPMEKD